MAKINVLEPKVYNLISAGEVVERPASVVKELVENSIDAGANRISISITDGGIRQICIVDNGCGIDEENLPLAFLPHATSKLKEARDLDDISTLGFRGEALASISAVAQVTFRSRTADSETGNQITVDGGQITERCPVGMPQGSCITVDNLFYHTPVRAKFLKKPKLEAAAVTQCVMQLILANPDVQFRYECDGKCVYQSDGGLESAVYSVFGSEIANRLYPVDYTRGGMRVFGYVADAAIAKHNKSHQVTIVNGRCIVNEQVRVAVMQAYGHRLMTKMHPIFVLNLILPFDQLDVNVHPAKSEVRFADPQSVFSVVYHGVASALAGQESALRLPSMQKQAAESVADPIERQQPIRSADAPTSVAPNKEVIRNDLPKRVESDNVSGRQVSDLVLDVIARKQQTQNERKQQERIERQSQLVADHRAVEQTNMRRPADKVSDTAGAIRMPLPPIQREESLQSDLFETIEAQLQSELRIVGQVLDTYLIVEYEQTVYLMDQHACHERVLYDELREQVDRKDVVSQPLLLPYTLQCNGNQYEYVEKMLPTLRRLGFDLEEFGGLNYKVTAIPMLLCDINLGKFFDMLLSEGKLLTTRQADLLQDKLAQTACKSAIKAGDKLSDRQIRALLSGMQNGVPLQCPHGRPAVLAYTRRDLDKLFKRIV